MRVHPLSIGLLLFLGGCSDTHFGPALPAEITVYDTMLVGYWVFDVAEGTPSGKFEIEEVLVPVKDGRLDPASWDVRLAHQPAPRRPPEGVDFETAYRIVLRPPPGDGGRANDAPPTTGHGTDTDPRAAITLYGYVVELNGRQYLGVHLGAGEVHDRLGPPFLLPTFMLLGYERTETELRLRVPRNLVMHVSTSSWSAMVQSDAAAWPWPPAPPEDLATRDGPDRDSWQSAVTDSIDALLRYYVLHAHEPEFFAPDPYLFVKDE